MMRHDFSKLQLRTRNHEWLTADFSLYEKLRFYPALVAAYLRLIFTGKKYVLFFGERFYYDNIASPLNLQNYPYEISHKILRNTLTPIRYALDIGGNIGQFPVALERLLPSIRRIDVLEPNPSVYKLLESNVAFSKKIKPYNYAVAKAPGLKFFYEQGRSATGSFIKENAGDEAARLTEIDVATTANIATLTKRNRYDLITIDVEGFEYDVLGLLGNLSTNYLYIEVSGAGRTKNYSHKELFERIAKCFGSFDVTFQSELIGNMTTIEYLFTFRT